MPAYDHTTDPTAFLVLDDRSTFTMSGSQVTGWSNVSAGGGAYNAVVRSGTGITKVTNGGGFSFPHFDGASTLKVVSSGPFDANFATTGNSGGWGILFVFKQNVGNNGWLFYKGASGTNNDLFQLTTYNGIEEIFGNMQAYRPYPQGVGTSFAMAADVGTSRPGGASNYRDGITLSLNGVPSARNAAFNPSASGGAGQNLDIGTCEDISTFAGDLYAIVIWNRTPKYHEILATHRYYAARFGLPETLTNQPFALIVDSNSESQVQGPTEPGIFDRVVTALGATRNCDFNLGRPSRSGADIVYDYPTWSAPLFEYIQSLGVQLAVCFWELINDGYSLTGAANVVSYQALLPPDTRCHLPDRLARPHSGHRERM